MARSHVMTPARRAALRKAQLVSAQRRRKYGVRYQTKNVARQKIAYAKVNKRKVAKYAAIGATLAGVGAAAYVGTKTPTYKYHKGMRKSTIKAYRSGKRGPALTTHQNRVRPLIKKNAGMKVRSQPRPTRIKVSSYRMPVHQLALSRGH